MLLCEDGRHWNTFVHEWITLPKFKQFFVRGKATNNLFGARELPFTVVALLISFKLTERNFLSGFCTVDSGSCPTCYGCYGILNPFNGVCCYSMPFGLLCLAIWVVLVVY